MLTTQIIGSVVAGGILAVGDQIRRWARKVNHRLTKIERLMDINGRDYAD